MGIFKKCCICDCKFGYDDLITQIDGHIYCQKHRPDKLITSYESVRNPIKPDHYHHGGLDVFTIMEANMPEDLEGFFCGNVLKYTIRQKRKNGIEDLEKAKEYLENWIAFKKKQ